MGPTDSTSPRNMPPSMAPGMLPMPPSTAAVKALMPGMKPLKKLTWMKMRPKSTPGSTGHGGADGEGHDDGAVHVDAHERRRGSVLRDGADGRAQLGAHREDVQAHHHQQRGTHDHDVQPLQAQRTRRWAASTGSERMVGTDRRRRRLRRCPRTRVLQEERGADGRDEQHQARRSRAAVGRRCAR